MILELGETRFDVACRPLVMGILNRTPDSFYDRGSYWSFDDFLRHAERLVAEGADCLDVGGVRAGPGPEVTVEAEIERVAPAVEALRSRFDVPVSVDTFRAAVLREAIAAGACAGNDISGFADPGYLPVAAERGASVVATHIRLGPRIADPDPVYGDVCSEVVGNLKRRAEAARAAGIAASRIMLDAGLDLGKTPAMSLELLRRSGELAALGFAVLLSASNKGFLGEAAGGADVDERRAPTIGAHALGIALGCKVLRAHDVTGAVRVADVMAAVMQRRGDPAASVAGPHRHGPKVRS